MSFILGKGPYFKIKFKRKKKPGDIAWWWTACLPSMCKAQYNRNKLKQTSKQSLSKFITYFGITGYLRELTNKYIIILIKVSVTFSHVGSTHHIPKVGV